MKAALPVKQDIFELVLDFYRTPSHYPVLLDSLAPLPEGITDLLGLTAGEVEARSKILTRAAASDAPSELIDATSYFSEQVLFAPGGDHYRVLGLNHDARIEDIHEHYDLLVKLFYQDNEDNSIQSNEADFSRLNRAYNILRDKKKRTEYDQLLETQGRLQRPEKSNEVDSVSQAAMPKTKLNTEKTVDNSKSTTENIQPIDSYISTRENANFRDSKEPVFVENFKSTNNNSFQPTHVSSAVFNGRLPKILIVDDSATVRAGLSLTLNKEFECITARDGEKAWKKIQHMNDILLVLTDLDMPELSGYDFIKRIRKNADARINTLPVIVVTGTEDIDAKQKAISVGADDFLAKSTDYIEVLTRVKVHYRLVKTKQQLDESQRKPALKIGFERNGAYSHPYAKIRERVSDSSEHKVGLNKFITIGAFAVVATVLVSLLYLSQIKPAGEITATNSDIDLDNEKDSVLSEKINKISREDELVSFETINEDVTEKTDKTSVVAVEEKKSEGVKKVSEAPVRSVVKKPIPIPIPTTHNTAKNVEEKSIQKTIQKDDFLISKTIPEEVPTLQKPITIKESIPVVEKQVVEKEVVEKQAWNLSDSQSNASVTSSVIKLPDRLPVPSDAPSVNNISTEQLDSLSKLSTIELSRSTIDSPADNTLAFIEPPESIVAKPKISQQELALFIFRFIRSYEDGNLFQFMGLFSENAKTEDRSDRKSIEDDYKDLFLKSAARRFILGDLDWKYNDDTAEGTGFFEVKIWPRGDDQFKTFTGEVTIEVLKTADRGLVITGLFHQF